MPMKLNVGASQKIAADQHGLRGASVNLEIELDSSLATDSAKLQDRIRQLFGLVRQSIAEELNANGGRGAQPNSPKQPASSSPPLNGRKPNNGNPDAAVRPATPAQIKAIFGMAKRQRVNLRAFIRSRCGVERPEELSLEQASELIDALKAANDAAARSAD